MWKPSAKEMVKVVCDVWGSVLVPFIFGINPAIVLFMNGVGTLIFIRLTKAKSPPSPPAGVVISKMGYPYALGGFVAVGLCGCILSFIIYKCGTKWIDIVPPPAAVGPLLPLLVLVSAAFCSARLFGVKIVPQRMRLYALSQGVSLYGDIFY